jgi:hypothetical protein
LAAFALGVPRAALRKLAIPVAAVGVAAVALYAAHWGHPTLILAAAALVLAALVRGERAVPLAALGLVVAEAASYPPPILRPRDVPDSYASLIASQSDIATFLRSRSGWFRVQFNEDDVPYNFGDLYGVEQFGGYVPGMPVRLNRALGDAETPRRYGVRYYVGKAPARPGQVEVFRSASGVRVFENPGIGEPISVRRDAPCASPDTLKVIARTSLESMFDAVLSCDGLIVVGDPYYRGWRATLDGVRVPIQEFQGGIRAVSAAAGRRRLRFEYRPVSFYLGVVLTALGLCVAGLMCRKGV